MLLFLNHISARTSYFFRSVISKPDDIYTDYDSSDESECETQMKHGSNLVYKYVDTEQPDCVRFMKLLELFALYLIQIKYSECVNVESHVNECMVYLRIARQMHSGTLREIRYNTIAAHIERIGRNFR